MSPMPATRVVSAGWEAHHRPVAEQAMTAVCDITRPGTGPGVFDPETGTTTGPDPVTVASGVPCRVQEQDQPRDADAAGQQVAARRYLVAVPYPNADVRVGDTVTVTAASDPSLAGRGLPVVDVQRGSLLFERDLECVDHQPRETPEEEGGGSSDSGEG